MEVVLKRRLRPGFADDGRERVAVFILITVPVLDAARVAENVGGGVRFINAHGGGVHLYAGIGAVLDERDERNVHIAGKFIAAQAVHSGDGQRVAQADNPARGRRGQRFVHAVFLAQAQVERRAGKPGGKALVRQRVVLADPLEGNEIFHQRFRAATPGIVGVGAAVGKRQRVAAVHALLLQQCNETKQRIVQLLGGNQRGIEAERVDGAVRYQHLAVAVGEDAARALHRLRARVRAHRLRTVIVSVDDLRIEHRNDEQQRAQKDHAAKDDQAAGKALCIHGGAPF